ncbi:unnamed protein product [Arctia plantaginis]|uniref:MADF domain-containing protein n=1 Tax=Arctia plantaginis TaxID=874455 RepID=A0A8S1A142_ARCPL|nr:unnamed protein product [Arctia plantaginis]
MEQFIIMVRQLPCLWDMECREYRDMRKKHAAWKRIVQELKSKDIPDIRTAKAEWKKLRDSHRDSLKRAKALGPHGAQEVDFPKVNKWKYAEHMEFLVPYMKTRKRGRNLAGLIDDEREDLSPSPSDSFLVVPSTSNDDSITFSPESNTQNNVDTTQEIDHKYRKRKIDDEFGEIMIDMEDRSRYTGRSNHPLDSFFESMCETTKQFPTWLQYSVKRKIFNVISEAEDTFESYKSREPIF